MWKVKLLIHFFILMKLFRTVANTGLKQKGWKNRNGERERGCCKRDWKHGLTRNSSSTRGSWSMTIDQMAKKNPEAEA